MLRWLLRRLATHRIQCGPLAKWGRPGDRVVDGGVPGVLVRCPECGGSGLLHRPDEAWADRWAKTTADAPPPAL